MSSRFSPRAKDRDPQRHATVIGCGGSTQLYFHIPRRGSRSCACRTNRDDARGRNNQPWVDETPSGAEPVLGPAKGRIRGDPLSQNRVFRAGGGGPEGRRGFKPTVCAASTASAMGSRFDRTLTSRPCAVLSARTAISACAAAVAPPPSAQWLALWGFALGGFGEGRRPTVSK